MKINKEIVNIFPANCHKDYTNENYVGGVRIRYLKQLMWLVKKHRVKDNKLLRIFVNKKRKLMPLWVSTKYNKKWILVAPCVPDVTTKKRENKRKFK